MGDVPDVGFTMARQLKRRRLVVPEWEVGQSRPERFSNSRQLSLFARFPRPIFLCYRAKILCSSTQGTCLETYFFWSNPA